MPSTAGSGHREGIDADAARTLETVVREDEAPAFACPHCSRPFAERTARDLHVGEAHPDECSDAQADALEAAREAERDDLFYFHLRVVAALGALYAFTILLYMLALGSDFI